MGNCLCLQGNPSDEKQLSTDRQGLDQERNILKSQEYSNKSITEDIKEDPSFFQYDNSLIIKLQSLMRGHTERKKTKAILLSFSNLANNTSEGLKQRSRNSSIELEVVRNEVKELPLKNIPNYSNQATRLIQTKLGQFIYGENLNTENLTKRTAVEMENGAIYTGE